MLLWRLEKVATPGWVLKTPSPYTSIVMTNEKQIAEILSVYHVTPRQRDVDFRFVPERVKALWRFVGGDYVTFDYDRHSDKTTWYKILKYDRKG